MTDRESFLAHIAEDTSDTSRMLVFSDWLEEHGELKEAQGWRYLVRMGKKPHHENPDYTGVAWWGWLTVSPMWIGKENRDAALPIPYPYGGRSKIRVYEWAAKNLELK